MSGPAFLKKYAQVVHMVLGLTLVSSAAMADNVKVVVVM
jgi:hypothetical protein